MFITRTSILKTVQDSGVQFDNLIRRTGTRAVSLRQVDESSAKGRRDADGAVSNEGSVKLRRSEQHWKFRGGCEGVRRARNVAVSAVRFSGRPQGAAAVRSQLHQPARHHRTLIDAATFRVGVLDYFVRRNFSISWNTATEILIKD